MLVRNDLVSGKPFVICPFVTRSEWDDKLGIPPVDHNLFGRIIRNPHPESDNPRERACAEMLAAALLNTRSLRDSLFSWMGRKIGVTSNVWESASARVRIETEQPMVGKRDDLRIIIESEDEPAVVWSVEVKVGAFFHRSSSINTGEEHGEEDNVNQVHNYDAFLSTEYPHADRGGFVLAKRNLQDHLPPRLKCNGRCITWAEIGLVIAEFLGGKDLPEKDAFLARHILGFIKTYLWEGDIMSNTSIEIDDISLLKAFGILGRECQDKIDKLVAPLNEIAKSIQGAGTPVHQAVLFQGNRRSVVWVPLLKGAKCPTFFAGIILGDNDDPSPKVSVWIETPPRHEIKGQVRQLVKDCLPELQKNRVCTWTQREDGWWDVVASSSMKDLLAAANQNKWMQTYVAGAINDLEAVGLIEQLQKIAK